MVSMRVSTRAVERVALLSVHSSPLAVPGTTDVGGMNVYVRALGEYLGSQGVRADVFTRRIDADAPEVVPLGEGHRLIHLRAGAARPLPKSVLPLHLPALVASLRAFTAREGTSYDILHSHYWLSGLAALQFRGHERTPLVHMFHTLSRVKEFYLHAPDTGDSSGRSEGERTVLEGADLVVGATREEKELMERLYGRSPATYAVVPPGVDMDLFRPRDRTQSRRRLGIDAEKVVLFVGRLDRIKGFDVLLRSLASMHATSPQTLKLIAVCDFQNENRAVEAPYRRLIRELHLENLVELRGTVPQRLMPFYYSAADVCAMPSAYESFGMVAVESMACQTPVVAFAVGGLATTIKHQQTGFLVSPGSTSAFAGQLEQALYGTDLDSVGRRARMSAQRYSWTSVGERTLDLYERIFRLRVCLLSRASGEG
jgi:D-inositol-3-phosphate glycosyltransferase